MSYSPIQRTYKHQKKDSATEVFKKALAKGAGNLLIGIPQQAIGAMMTSTFSPGGSGWRGISPNETVSGYDAMQQAAIAKMKAETGRTGAQTGLYGAQAGMVGAQAEGIGVDIDQKRSLMPSVVQGAASDVSWAEGRPERFERGAQQADEQLATQRFGAEDAAARGKADAAIRLKHLAMQEALNRLRISSRRVGGPSAPRWGKALDGWQDQLNDMGKFNIGDTIKVNQPTEGGGTKEVPITITDENKARIFEAKKLGMDLYLDGLAAKFPDQIVAIERMRKSLPERAQRYGGVSETPVNEWKGSPGDPSMGIAPDIRKAQFGAETGPPETTMDRSYGTRKGTLKAEQEFGVGAFTPAADDAKIADITERARAFKAGHLEAINDMGAEDRAIFMQILNSLRE